MRFPSSFIDRVKSSQNLSDVIARRITIKRHGKEFQACCPFHHEKTPSFTINNEKNFYHCFGCGAHGNAITFLMEYDKLSYVDAIKALASESGIPLPKQDPRLAAQYDKEEPLLRLMEAAARWFSSQLSASVGFEARTYLQERGINNFAKETFAIGYAPARRDGLKLAMQQAGFSEQQMLDAGLLIKTDGKPSYDRFRGRVMFPIRRIDGKVIAFGGRLLAASDYAPKYLNSPETLLFKKNETLFNLDYVKSNRRDIEQIVVVEGYTDVIALHAHGIKGAVAALGTAFGEPHLQQLWHYDSNPVFCFDGDKAGQKAMLRAAEIALPLLTPHRLIRFCGLPVGEDPDSFVRASGADALKQLLEGALSMSQVLWNVHIGNREFSTPELLAAAEDKLISAANRIENATLKSRILSSYKNRLWHIGKQHGVQFMAAKQKAGLSSKAQGSLMRQLEQREVALMEQAFALFALYPSLLRHPDAEHALFEWDWSQTAYHDCVCEVANQSETLQHSRHAIEDFFASEYPVIDIYLKKQLADNVLSPALQQQSEQEGLQKATRIFMRLKEKIEQFMLAEQSLIAADSQEDQLLELVKLQQKAHAMSSAASDDSYT